MKAVTRVDNYIQRVEKIGFEKVLEVPFSIRDDDKKQRDETFFVFFHEEYGIILEFDTFGGDLNGGRFYYEWRPNASPERVSVIAGINIYDVLKTGGFEPTTSGEKAWVGYNDCRNSFDGETIESSIQTLASIGTFVTPWSCSSPLFRPDFVHHGDHHTEARDSWDKGFEMYKTAKKTVGVERRRMLPEKVQKVMRVVQWGGK